MNKNIVFTSLSAIFTCLSIPFLSTVAIASTQDFVVYNFADQTVMRLYVSSAGSNVWEEDVLHSQVLGAGENVTVNFSNDTQACIYDIRAVFRDGQESDTRSVNLCEVTNFYLR